MSHSDFVMLSLKTLHSHSTRPCLSSDVLLLKQGCVLKPEVFPAHTQRTAHGREEQNMTKSALNDFGSTLTSNI